VCTENSILIDYVTESPIAPAVLADRRAAQSLPSPANDVGFNLTVGKRTAAKSRSYSITSSAGNSNLDGTVRPSAFAVSRLNTSTIPIVYRVPSRVVQ
jgi:hypothetical protein